MPRPGLSRAGVVAAGADLADEIGFTGLSMGLLAERLGVRTPSLYKHIEGQAALAHRIAILAMDELADAIRDAIQGRSGPEALAAGARAMRDYVHTHPGRYAAGHAARAGGEDDPLRPALARVMASWTAMLSGYRLPPEHDLHARRMLRSMLHGFSDIEAAGGFQIDVPVDESFAWIVDFVDRGLRALGDPTREQTGSSVR